MPSRELCEYCNQRPKLVEDNGRVHAYCGRGCSHKAQNAPRAVNPPPSADLCKNCGERPKYKDLSGEVQPYCGKKCASTMREDRLATNRKEDTHPGPGRSHPPAGLANLLAAEVDIARKTSVRRGDNTLLSNLPRNWKIEDTHGSSQVVFRRRYQIEEIVISMSLNDNDPLDDHFPDFSDAEDDDGGDAVGSGEESIDEPVGAVPCTITITKPDRGALLVRALAADGKFVVDNLTHTRDVGTATGFSVEADFAREKLYIAPQFDDLVQGLQDEFMNYLQARGIDDSLAQFLVEYVKRKETLERVNWLEGLYSFFT